MTLGHIVRFGKTDKRCHSVGDIRLIVGSNQENKLAEIILDDEEKFPKSEIRKGRVVDYESERSGNLKYMEGCNVRPATPKEVKFYESKEVKRRQLKLVLADERNAAQLYIAFARNFLWLLEGWRHKEGIIGNALYAHTKVLGIPMEAYRAQMNGEAQIIHGDWSLYEKESPGIITGNLLDAAWNPKFANSKPELEKLIKKHVPEFKPESYAAK